MTAQVDAWTGQLNGRQLLIREYSDGTKTWELFGPGSSEHDLEPEPWTEWLANQFFVAPDGGGEPTLWQHTSGDPKAIQRRCDVEPFVWSLLVRWARGTADMEVTA